MQPPTLADHPEFAELLRAAAAHHGLVETLVTKDYWVTRVLRAIVDSEELQRLVLFKGGTSLSKGWKLIDRFSEDVDLLLTGENFGPVPEDSGTRVKLMKLLRKTIEEATPLRLPDKAGLAKKDWEDAYVRAPFNIKMRLGLPGNLAPMWRGTASVFVEAGFRGGPHPQEERQIQSMLGEFITDTPDLPGKLTDYADDIGSFPMTLLKPERTAAEKILLLHQAMAEPDGAHEVPTRHFYDVARLWERSPEVQDRVRDGTILVLIKDAALISNEYFDARIAIETIDLRSSHALTPTTEQVGILTARYDDQNERALYYRERPSFPEILSTLAAIKDALP